MNNTTRVEIYDQSYQIAGDSNEEYVRRLAADVDGRMRQIARQTKIVDSLRVAVLAAINLADENEALRNRCSRLEQAISEKTSEFHELLDRALTRAS